MAINLKARKLRYERDAIINQMAITPRRYKPDNKCNSYETNSPPLKEKNE